MTVVRFHDLSLADRKRRYDGDAATKRIRKWAGAQEKPNSKYRAAFVWYDANKKDKFGSYKLGIADVINGRLVAVPRAIMAAAAVVQGSRGGVRIPRRDVPRVKSHLARYYAKMGDVPPWER